MPPVDAKPFDEGPANTDEVHTQIIVLNMTDPGGSGAAVRAGTAAPDAPRSIGEVESKTAAEGGVGEGAFPAESFFDIFVEVDVPGLGTLFNRPTDPLLIENGDLLGFPPRVIYVHGNSSAVAVLKKADPNTLVGWLIVAGHGIGFDKDNPVDVQEFNERYQQLEQEPMQIIVVGGIAEVVSEGNAPLSPGSGSGASAAPYAALAGGIAAAVLAMVAGGWYARRRWLR